jgi:hypothetical protein
VARFDDIPSEVRDILARAAAFRGRSCHVTSIYHRHQEEKCFRIDVAHDDIPYKLRLVTETSILSAANEYEALSILRASNVTWAPSVFEYRPAHPSYLVTEFVEGRSLDTGAWWLPEGARIRDSLAQKLDTLHAITGSFHGHLAGPAYRTWRAFLDVRFWHHVRRCEAEAILSSDDIRRIEALYDDTGDACSKIDPRLLHADVKPANLVATRVGACHPIDFEITRFGDVDFEWVKIRWLALRWPEYLEHIAEPLLAEKLPSVDVRDWPPKLLLYAIYHVCSILEFERDVNLPSPTYRWRDLRLLLDIVRSRYG